MPKDNLICPICSQEYNLTDRLPRTFISCSHNVCSACLKSYIVDQEIICPIDFLRIPTLGKGIEILPPNYSLKHLIENKQDADTCQEHGEKLRLICLDDKTLICDDCVHYGNHKGHIIKPLKKLQTEADEKIKKLQGSLDSYDTYWKGIEKIYEETRGNLLKSVKEEFQNLRWLLQMKELELSYEINSFFDSEKAKLNENLGRSSTSRRVIKDKLTDVKSMYDKKGFMEILEQDFTPFVSTLNFEALHGKTQELRKGFEETLDIFDTALITRVQPFIVLLDFPATELASKTDVIFFDEEDNFPLRKSHKEEIISVKEVFPQAGLRRSNEAKSIVLDKAQLEDIRNMTSKAINQPNSADTHRVVQPLWRQFGEAVSFKIDFSSNPISDREFFDCCLLTDWGSKNVQKFELFLKETNIREYSIIPLVSEILPKMSKLRRLHMDFSKTKISDISIGAFPRNTLASLENLEDLELNLSRTNVSDHVIISLFENLKTIRNLKLDLDFTQITDESLYAFVKTTLPKAKHLDTLSLDLSNTQITDQSAVPLFSSVKSIKRLTVNLSWTQVTSSAIDSFAMYCLPYMKNLESLNLYFWSTTVTFETLGRLFVSMYNKKHLESVKLSEKAIEVFSNYPLSITRNLDNLEVDLSASVVTDQGVIPIFVDMATVKVCKLNLSYTNITNASIVAFVKNSLVTMQNLKVLELNLSGAMVSDDGVNWLFERLDNLTTLVLNLSSTYITDRCVELFLRNTYPTMQALKRFEMDLSDTRVTPETQAVIAEIAAKHIPMEDN